MNLKKDSYAQEKNAEVNSKEKLEKVY
ncbi:hypothetical protein IFM89_020056 [Coptis chinensis]|uniref:Uncharacterized protein n=1 Tax=Coptis chinensis TaxID=261450 RepID=A0A835IWU8_9MAGN|nr:hypothetical protein IFM89_020056 [Coptis chinensis]